MNFFEQKPKNIFRFPKHIVSNKYLFFVVAFMATLIPTLLYTNTGREETLYISSTSKIYF